MAMTALAIAAGGGGDAITAAILARKLPHLGTAAIMSYSWDRLLMDPVPGPRARADFDGLIDHQGVSEVPVGARLRVGRSTLPPLAQHISRPLLLMDIDAGVVGLSAQIIRAAQVFEADEIIVVDVGGDILARGDEAGLRSPLADSVALAAAVDTGLPTAVLVAGVGMDGELSVAELHSRIADLGAVEEAALTASDVDPFAAIWEWHPSEASGLLVVAASGWRGRVETQRDAVLEVTDETPAVYRLDGRALADASLADVVAATTSLDQVEELLRARGYVDIDIERRKLASRTASRAVVPGSMSHLDRYAAEAAARGVDALTIRRCLELTHATAPESAGIFRRWLADHRPGRFQPPLYLVKGTASELLQG